MEAVSTFQLPVAINVYMTSAGQNTSAPLHTDKQDVLVFQTSGQKHWRVYSPPSPASTPFADPLARGKGSDLLHHAELQAQGKGEPLVDVMLRQGEVLYAPAGFPHTTGAIEP